MVLKCPSCGKDIKDEGAIYCSYCGKPLKQIASKKTGYPIAGGIITIIASFASIIIGLVFLLSFLSGYLHYQRWLRWNFLFAGLFGIVAFAFGLTAGIMSLKGKKFELSITGVCFVLIGGFVNFLALALPPFSGWPAGLVVGLQTILLSILSLIFIAVSKGEFS